MKMHIQGLIASASLLTAFTASHAAQGIVSFGQGEQAIPSQYVAEYVPGQQQVHLVGVYDGGAQGGKWFDERPYFAGTTYVNVQGVPDEKVSLVLSSYEGTHWIIQGEGAAALDSVLIQSYHASSVTGVDASKVTLTSFETDGTYASCAYGWPATTGGCNTPALVGYVEGVYGVPISSFTGTYTTFPERGRVFLEPGDPATLQVFLNLSGSAVPEPATNAMWLLGASAMVWARRRQRSA
jgi:PEP-CTERM motif